MSNAPFSAGRKFNGSIGRARTYFYDANTGEELFSGADLGNHEAGIWNGRRYFGTHLGFSVVDPKTMVLHEVTAADFPGRRVLVKQWHVGVDGNGHGTWSLLVDRAKGWRGNEACRELREIERVEYDVMRHVSAMPRRAA